MADNPYKQASAPPDAAAIPSPQPTPTAAVVNPYAFLFVKPEDSIDVKLTKLQGVLDKYNIKIAHKNELMKLLEYEIVFLCDDSGSMNMHVPKSHCTRWEELRQTVNTLVEISCYLDSDGVDLHFLNRPSLCGVNSPEDPRLIDTFSKRPSGTTPLVEAIEQKILPKYETNDKNILLVIATDGEPNGGPGAFKSLVGQMIRKSVTRKAYKIQVMACTDNDEEIKWLNKFDKMFPNVDVTDDFQTEKLEILRGGKIFSFNRADYIVKALLGPVVKRFDDMDEKSVKETNYCTPVKKSDGCDCTIL